MCNNINQLINAILGFRLEMADIFSKAKRSEVMSLVRGTGNRSTELRLIELLREASITGWRRKHPLPGRPDFVFVKHHLAIFVDGCFWHGCPKHLSKPATNRAFWMRKLTANKNRDRLVTQVLKKRGWRVLRIWQHALTRKHEGRCVMRIRRALSKNLVWLLVSFLDVASS